MDEPQTQIPEGLLSLHSLAAYLDCSRSHARGLIADGTIPSLKIGYLRRVRKSDVDAYIDEQMKAGRR